MKWLTWEGVGVDRMGSAWLIKRFIDPAAEFTFAPAGQGSLQGDAEPFDIPGVPYSHRRGHCTFHTLMKSYCLSDPVLERIAAIVDEADSAQETLLEPAAFGLDLVCRGLRRISADDAEALARGAEVYQALYSELAAEQGAEAP